jgi:hypothetical protein
MSIEAGTVYVPVRPDMTGFGTSISTQSSSIFRTAGGALSTLSKALIAVPIAGAVVGAIGGVVSTLGEWTTAAEEAQAVTRGLATRLAEMGQKGRPTVDALGDMNDELALMSGIDDELITGGTTLLATFGNIRDEVGQNNDIFTQANALMVDYAAQFTSGNMESAATQLGKALDNPVKGMSALARVGVSFTDKQTKMIEALVKSNDLLGAQKVIIEAVRPQVEGAARANATWTDRLNVAWKNFTEFIGEKLLPVIKPVMKVITNFLADITRGTKSIGEIWEKTWEKLKEAWTSRILPYLQTAWSAFMDFLTAKVRAALANLVVDFINAINKILQFIPGGQATIPVPDITFGTTGGSVAAPPIPGGTGNAGSRGGRNPGRSSRPQAVYVANADDINDGGRHAARMARSNR